MNKIKYIILIIVLLLIVGSCTNSPKKTEVITYSSADSLIDKEQIISDIEKSLHLLDSGIAYQNADLIFSLFDDNRDATYVRNGEIYNSWEEAKKQYAKWFGTKEAKKVKKDFVFQSKHFDFINPNTVLFTGLGSIYTLPNTKKSWDIAYTILYVKIQDEGWQAINMHISWP